MAPIGWVSNRVGAWSPGKKRYLQCLKTLVDLQTSRKKDDFKLNRHGVLYIKDSTCAVELKLTIPSSLVQA